MVRLMLLATTIAGVVDVAVVEEVVVIEGVEDEVPTITTTTIGEILVLPTVVWEISVKSKIKWKFLPKSLISATIAY